MTAPKDAATPGPWMPTSADMRGGFTAAKRIHVEHGHDPDWSWWVGYGKDSSCQIEGTPSHWFWLAYLMLGLADPKDAPYSEDKPLPCSPEYVRRAVNAHDALVKALRDVSAAADALEKANDGKCALCGESAKKGHADDCRLLPFFVAENTLDVLALAGVES